MPVEPPPRIVTLVLVSAEGEVLGQLPPFAVDTPWWQDAGPVVAVARERFGLDVTILRLLATELPSAHGGAVTYLAEVDAEPSRATGPNVGLEPWDAASSPMNRCRLPYARPGGPAADLAWADASPVDTRSRSERTGRAGSNLEPVEPVAIASRRWRGLAQGGPGFLRARGGLDRTPYAAKPCRSCSAGTVDRMLFAEIAGEDQYGATGPVLLEMVDMLVDIQAGWLGRTGELAALGLPDWRATSSPVPSPTSSSGRRLTCRGADRADARDIRRRRCAIASRRSRHAGIPDGLVHGDFHPGNVRGEPGRLVLLDWGDSGIGHPLLDEPAFLSRIEPADVPSARGRWHAAWRRRFPDQTRTEHRMLLAPVAAARQAVIYRRFLDNIEPSEQAYHQADVPDWLRRTADILAALRR